MEGKLQSILKKTLIINSNDQSFQKLVKRLRSVVGAKVQFQSIIQLTLYSIDRAMILELLFRLRPVTKK